MLVKASIAATALFSAVVSLSSLDLHQLYNEMYPVNGLRRDVLGLCHAADPTFVRAVRADREGCYDSMPNPIELAIGWVRTSSRLAAMRPLTGPELAEQLLKEAELRRPAGSLAPLHFAANTRLPAMLSPDCATPARRIAATEAAGELLAAEDSSRLARGIANGEEATLTALGLLPRVKRPDAATDEKLPVLPLSGSAKPEPAPANAAFAAAGLLSPVPALDLGDSAASRLAPAAAMGCRAPA